MLNVGFNPNTSVQKNNSSQSRSQNQIAFGAWEKTLLGLKPDAFEKKLAAKLEKEAMAMTGLTVVKKWVGVPSREKMEIHYAEHKAQSFFNDLINYVTRGKFKAVVLEGDDAVLKLRTAAKELRTKYAQGSKTENLIHSSDSTESADREIKNFFG